MRLVQPIALAVARERVGRVLLDAAQVVQMHWERVATHAWLISEAEGQDPLLPVVFALVHESQRRTGGMDPQHGPRAAVFVAGDRHVLFTFLSPANRELLAETCRDHSAGLVSDRIELGVCWDADRLDLEGRRPAGPRLPVDGLREARGRHPAGVRLERRVELWVACRVPRVANLLGGPPTTSPLTGNIAPRNSWRRSARRSLATPECSNQVAAGHQGQCGAEGQRQHRLACGRQPGADEDCQHSESMQAKGGGKVHVIDPSGKQEREVCGWRIRRSDMAVIRHLRSVGRASHRFGKGAGSACSAPGALFVPALSRGRLPTTGDRHGTRPTPGDRPLP